MIQTEFYQTRADGVTLVRAYSDEGFFITREEDGEALVFEEAIDPEDSGRVYNETDVQIPEVELSAEEALAVITGGEV